MNKFVSSENRFVFLWSLVFFSVNLVLFERFIRLGMPVDWPHHVKFALDPEIGLPTNFLLHILIRIFGESSLVLAGIAASAKTACLLIVFKVFLRSSSPLRGAGLATGVALAMPVFFLSLDPRPYLGTFSPNLAHNPTYILMLPFALGLWFVFSRQLFKWNSREINRVRPLWLIGFASLSVVTALAKPSFHLALIPTAMVLCAIVLIKTPNHLVRLLTLGVALSLPILLQMFALSGLLPFHVMESSFIIAPFQALAIHVKDPAGALISSLLFPILVAPLAFQKNQKGTFFAWSLILFASALIIAILFAEAGHRIAHANFYWSIYAAVFIVFVESAVLLDQILERRSNPTIRFTASIVLGMHAIAGILYLVALAAGMDPLFATYDEWLLSKK